MVAMHSGRLWAELVPALETAKRRLNPNNAEGTLRELYNTAIVFYLDHRAEMLEAAGESLTPLGKLPAKAKPCSALACAFPDGASRPASTSSRKVNAP
ncbi:MAG: hypothetical protein U1F57_00015 [bacterium]